MVGGRGIVRWGRIGTNHLRCDLLTNGRENFFLLRCNESSYTVLEFIGGSVCVGGYIPKYVCVLEIMLHVFIEVEYNWFCL